MSTVARSAEDARLAALREYEILDTEPEQVFDDLTAIASYICGTPIAMISLVDSDRQWFKSKVGLSVSETARDISFCTHAILQPDLFIVDDALRDPRFASSPLVTSEPKIRFYAGAPLFTADGLHALGTLCVIDRVPRELSPEQKEALKLLSRHVQAQLELRRHLKKLKQVTAERERAERALRESEETQRDLLENANDLIQSVAPDGRLTYVNRAWREVLGYTDDDLARITIFDIIDPDSRPHCLDAFQRVMEGESIERVEAVFVAKDDRKIAVEGSVNCRIVNGTAVSTRGIFRDISQRKKAEEALRDSETRYRALVESSQGLISIHDMDGMLTAVNPAAADLLGYEPSEMVGKNLAQFIAPSARDSFCDYLERIRRYPTDKGVMRMVTRTGEERILVYRNSRFEESGKRAYVLGHAQDITDLKRAQEHLKLALQEREKELARIDPLTGVANRRAFYEFAAVEKSRGDRYGRPLTVAYLDVDNLKVVNEKLGPPIGDAVLLAVAITIHSNLRDTDVVARLGGDEFAILLPETGAEAAETVVQKLRTLLLEAMKKNDWPVTFSIGVVTYNKPPESPEEMVRKADDLMYVVKASGKDAIKQEVSPQVPPKEK